MHARIILLLAFGSMLLVSGCGRQAMVLLETPKDYPSSWRAKRLYHTTNAYIYASTEHAADEANAWVGEARTYITKTYHREWIKGVVIALEPGDAPIVRTLEEELELECDPTVMRTPPRKTRTVDEVRKKFAENGTPELPAVRSATVPLSAAKLRQIGLETPTATWAVAAPSHELAAECSVPVMAGMMRKKFPGLVKSDEQAMAAAERSREKGAKAFEVGREIMLTIVWIQQQADWSDDQRRRAIRDAIGYTYHSNWLPAPKDEDLDW